MTGGIRTCPNCLMRVVPLADGHCPACRRFNFKESPSDERTVQAAQAAARASTRARIRRAALLHWQAIGGLVVAVVLVVTRVYVGRLSSAGFVDAPLDRSRLLRLLSIGAAVAAAFAWQRSSALASEIRLASGGARDPGLLSALKAAMVFFEDNHVPMGRFGPRMSQLPEENEPSIDPENIKQRRTMRAPGRKVHLQAYIADWNQITQIAGSKSEDVLQQVADCVGPGDPDDEAFERAGAIVQQIVNGDRIDDLEMVGYAVDLVYRAFGNWPTHSPEVECDETDVIACVEALRGSGFAHNVRALDWSRGSPVFPADQRYPGLRLAYMTPAEIAAAASSVKAQDWSLLPPGSSTIMRALVAWIAEAAASPDEGLLVVLWESR